MFDKALMTARRKTAAYETPGGVITIRRPTISEFRGYLKGLRRGDGKDVDESEADAALAAVVCEDEDGSKLFADSAEVREVLAPGELIGVRHIAQALIYGEADPTPTPAAKPAS